jgi:hypothetical protein
MDHLGREMQQLSEWLTQEMAQSSVCLVALAQYRESIGPELAV